MLHQRPRHNFHKNLFTTHHTASVSCARSAYVKVDGADAGPRKLKAGLELGAASVAPLTSDARRRIAAAAALLSRAAATRLQHVSPAAAPYELSKGASPRMAVRLDQVIAPISQPALTPITATAGAGSSNSSSSSSSGGSTPISSSSGAVNAPSTAGVRTASSTAAPRRRLFAGYDSTEQEAASPSSESPASEKTTWQDPSPLPPVSAPLPAPTAAPPPVAAAHSALLAMLRDTHDVGGPAAYAINTASVRGTLPSDLSALSLLVSRTLSTPTSGPAGWETALARDSLLDLIGARPVLLLTHPPSYHLAALAVASDMLGLPGTTAAAKLGAEGPDVLARVLEDPTWLPGRLTLLRDLLDLPRSAVAHMVALCPRLLLMVPAAVAEHFVQLADALGATPAQTRRAAAKWPGLLALDGGALVARADAAREAIGMRPKAFAEVLLRCPPLLAQKPDTLSRKRAALSSLLRLSVPQLDRIVFHFPWVLSQNVDTVASHVHALTELLGLTSDQVGQLLFQIPNLLGFKPETLAFKVEQLSIALGMTRAQTIDIIVGKPAVLASSVDKVARTWALITALTAAAPNWATSFAALSPASLGLVITSSERRLLRLHFLEAKGLQSSLSFVSALVRTDTFFNGKFPEYVDWARAKEAGMVE